ncbi:MAG: glycogen-binding domain-containing protein [Spirochaetes bacterium]|nr:glycogen-binding domain-containing protein [Spirochaetota bacterium]
MKSRAIIAIIPILFLALHPGTTGEPVYFSSLKFTTRADAPRRVTMVLPGKRQGQSTMVCEGVLLTYGNRTAKNVFVAGNFSGWKPLAMKRSDSGIWYHFLEASGKGSDLAYKYLVDGIWIADPLNPDRIDDRMGSYLSIAEPPLKSEGRHVSWRYAGRDGVEFRLYRPKARFVSIVGDFNNWNPEDDLLEKGPEGIWRLRKQLLPGMYRYSFIIDGEWHPDVYNPRSGSDANGMVCSIIEIRRKTR